MTEHKVVTGFSKLSKLEKLEYFASHFDNPKEVIEELVSYFYNDVVKQKLFDEFSENTISNYYLPYGIIPNIVINGKNYTVPLVIEECSVVAAASSGAKFWSERGGFISEVVSIKKIGQVHFIWRGDKAKLHNSFPILKEKIMQRTAHITSNMVERGGGILDIQLVDKTSEIPDYYQLMATIDTRDSMGANFINSCLEEFTIDLKEFFSEYEIFKGNEKECHIIMAILSNYTPECLVKTTVGCEIKDFKHIDGLTPDEFVWKFEKAVKIAEVDVYRATTHNKGIFNGIDAVALATGNDFRAIEACAHAYASRNGRYQSLTELQLDDKTFQYSLTVPLALGTVGGVTALHPLAKKSMQVLGNPDAPELMMIAASAGLANNYSAIRALITQGIQKGHMKMHLSNILNFLDATIEEKNKALEYFKTHKVSFKNGVNFIMELRKSRSLSSDNENDKN